MKNKKIFGKAAFVCALLTMVLGLSACEPQTVRNPGSQTLGSQTSQAQRTITATAVTEVRRHHQVTSVRVYSWDDGPWDGTTFSNKDTLIGLLEVEVPTAQIPELFDTVKPGDQLGIDFCGEISTDRYPDLIQADSIRRLPSEGERYYFEATVMRTYSDDSRIYIRAYHNNRDYEIGTFGSEDAKAGIEWQSFRVGQKVGIVSDGFAYLMGPATLRKLYSVLPIDTGSVDVPDRISGERKSVEGIVENIADDFLIIRLLPGQDVPRDEELLDAQIYSWDTLIESQSELAIGDTVRIHYRGEISDLIPLYIYGTESVTILKHAAP